MKLAASTLGCPDWDFEKILSEYSKIGIEGIEIRGLEGETDADKIERFAPENAENTLNKLKEKNLKLVGFGTFEVRERGERTGRNPQTKETITIPASKLPVFKAGKAFKDAVAK